MEIFLTNRKRYDFPFLLKLGKVDDMPLDICRKALELKDNDDALVVLNGAEPALYPDLEDVFMIAQRNGKRLLLETSGLLPEGVKQLILQYKPSILFRIYRKECYAEGAFEEADNTIRAFIAGGLEIQNRIYVDDLTCDYAPCFARGMGLGLGVFLVRCSCMGKPMELQKLMTELSSPVLDCLRKGGRVFLDCGVPLCSFQDEVLGKFTRLGVTQWKCLPKPIVMPDGHLAHCWEMTGYPGKSVCEFDSEAKITQYYMDLYRQMQLASLTGLQCNDCITRHCGLCYGPPLAYKAKCNEHILDTLKPLIENPPSGAEDKHLGNLREYAFAAIRLARHEEAIACLEELRRQEPSDDSNHYWLANAYWETGRKAEAEEEYRKCARLAKEPIPVLVELHDRLVKNGNAIKSRMLLEEIKRMAKERENR